MLEVVQGTLFDIDEMRAAVNGGHSDCDDEDRCDDYDDEFCDDDELDEDELDALWDSDELAWANLVYPGGADQYLADQGPVVDIRYNMIFRADEVRAAKEHRCAWCGETIDLGERHFSRAYLVDCSFKADRLHMECMTALEASDVYALIDGWLFESYAQRRGEPVGWDEE